MKVNITSTSLFWEKRIPIEVDSIEDAIKQIKENKSLLKTLTELEDPDTFVLSIPEDEEDYDYQLEIYDDWRE